MVTHMKTTIEIDDRLLEQMKARARQRGITLRRLLEEFARDGLSRPVQRRRFVLKDLSFRGDGLKPGIDLANREQMRAILYPDH
jgi:hypothetical protein